VLQNDNAAPNPDKGWLEEEEAQESKAPEGKLTTITPSKNSLVTIGEYNTCEREKD